MKEYGGCLHFETGCGMEYYHEFADHKVDVDSGRSALQYIIDNFDFKRIWMPIYNCPLVHKRIREMSDIEICWYNINENFFPSIDFNEFMSGDVMLWINYCGVMPSALIDTIAEIEKETPASVIIDNIPAYFAPPRMNVLNIYSCRKFLGVPDGGHVIGSGIKMIDLPVYSTASNYLYLLEAIEKGSDAVYIDYQKSEKRFSVSNTAYGMPKLTSRILKGIDYGRIIEVRKNNFESLHKILESSNRLILDTDTITPLVYPYLASSKPLRSNLLDKKIFISRFWKHVLTNDKANAFEKDLAEYLIPLPIDQRYNIKDMYHLAEMVLKLS